MKNSSTHDETGHPRPVRPQQPPWSAAELEAEYDPRLADVWISVFEFWPAAEAFPPEVGWFLRMAYTAGYGDALTDEPGALFKNLGLVVSLPVHRPKAGSTTSATKGRK